MIIVMTETEQPTSPLIQVTGVKWITLMMLGLSSIASRDPGCKVSPAIGDFGGQTFSRGTPVWNTRIAYLIKALEGLIPARW